ncbi:hypothetical protein JTB14_002930 [Gonioctena quinquepunctata]|nr:hypothetical protein JTB14_002930 [Gonioctena quinquepunctata]
MDERMEKSSVIKRERLEKKKIIKRNTTFSERLNRRTLKPKVVPSKYLPKLPHEADLGPSSRIPRTRQIQTSTTDKASPNNNEASEMFPLCENDGNGEDAQDIETVGALLALLIPKH